MLIHVERSARIAGVSPQALPTPTLNNDNYSASMGANVLIYADLFVTLQPLWANCAHEQHRVH